MWIYMQRVDEIHNMIYILTSELFSKLKKSCADALEEIKAF